jgi:membrane-bound serine protease (ClpP class)
MDYLTIALVLMALGGGLLVAEILLPTGGFLVVGALFFFALAVGVILYYGTTVEAVVALGGLAVGLPASGFVAVAAWRRMSLDTALDAGPTDPPAAPPTGGALKGRTGKTVSPLRPSGSVEFDGKRVDAMTEGTMLDAGVWVRCVDVKRGQVIVRALEAVPDVSEIEPGAAADLASGGPAGPKAAGPAPEQPKKDEPKRPRDDFDDFDIGLDKI